MSLILQLLAPVLEVLGVWPLTKDLPPLSFHNTLGGKDEAVTPLTKREVKMYNCGPTVYDQVHIGNLRSYIFADTIRRALDLWGYRTKQVINITDVGHLVGDTDEGADKMEESAKKKGKKAQDIASEITELFFEDLDLLGIDRKRITFPRATEYIAEQIALIQSLEQKGYTYTISDGVYFDTQKFKDYGKLGHINLEGQQEGARVEENKEKKSPHDFALWKFSPKGEKRQQEWPSPWGVGFPGWHIECTAMIFKLLGKQIDIHTGGIDHIPVHHNNEIAQAEAATGKRYVQTWMHQAFITIEGKKISKSLGNTIYLHQLVDKGYSPKALRYWYLTGHYRSPMNFTWDAIEGANTALMRLTKFFFEELADTRGKVDAAFAQDFYAAIANDLDTPKAIARIWELVKDDAISPASKRASLLLVDKVLGLGLSDKRVAVKINVVEKDDMPQDMQNKLAEREEARASKDFARADTLRKEIEEAGYELKDTPKGAKITRR